MKLHFNHSNHKGYESFDQMCLMQASPYRGELYIGGYRLSLRRRAQADRRECRRLGYPTGFLKIRPWRG